MAIEWQIGERIKNRWEVYKILKGGMGVVYLVYDHEHHNVYAAKTFREEFFASSPAIIERFVQEAHAWINLDFHQNVTKARFVNTIAGKPYLFLEYISGGDLSHWIGTRRLTSDLAQVLRFAVQFCDGMVHALSKGIEAHRDIKPQNCLITEDTLLKITDFGLAKVQTISSLRGTCAGTPEYMAPEQWDDFEKADERSDIYSFGAMLYEMLSSTPPFGRRPRVAISELQQRHVIKKPPELSSHPKSLQKLLNTCLAKDQTNRFANFTDLREELRQIYKELTGQHVPIPDSGPTLTVSDLITKGSSLGALGKHYEELACYQQAIELDRNEWRAWTNKGTSLAELGELDQALRCQE